jgi:hypothetical protein
MMKKEEGMHPLLRTLSSESFFTRGLECGGKKPILPQFPGHVLSHYKKGTVFLCI